MSNTKPNLFFGKSLHSPCGLPQPKSNNVVQLTHRQNISLFHFPRQGAIMTNDYSLKM